MSDDESQDQRPSRRAGDEDASAWGRLLDGCRSALRAQVRRMMPPAIRARESASDVVQQALEAAVRHRDQFAGGKEPTQVRAWLTAILRHRFRRAVDRHRAARRDVAREAGTAEEVQPAAPADPSSAGDERARLRGLLAGLPEDARALLRLRFEDDLSFPAIAARLGVSEDAARMRCTRLVAELRGRMAG